MRITGGELKNRKIKVPDLSIPGFRPTTDIIREMLFSSIQHYFSLDRARILDLYAGTGIISFECLSRGAEYATAIERNPVLSENMRDYVGLFQLKDRMQVKTLDVSAAIQNESPYNFIYVDAPYDTVNFLEFTEKLINNEIFSTNSLYVYEDRSKNIKRIAENKEYENFSCLSLKKVKSFGDSGLIVCQVNNKS